MIVSCSKDNTIIVWKVITRNILSAENGIYEHPMVEMMSKLEAHKNEVWRISWNILGTCFASSGDDGTVRIWKKNLKGKFNQIACL